MSSFPPSHPAVVTTAKRAPLSVIEVPTRAPAAGEVVVRVQWTGCTPLDLHRADGALLAIHPHILGDSFSGIVVAIGDLDTTTTNKDEQQLEVGDRVAGFAWQESWHSAWQTHVTVPRNLIGHVPANISMQAAAAVSSSLVTAVHTITADLGLDLPWPIPPNWSPPKADAPILIWGASGTVGTYALQVLRHWGYSRLLAVASSKNHASLRNIGASVCFDYADADVCEQILAIEPKIMYIVDCIGSLENTLRPLTKIARRKSKVAVMLPVIVRDATAEEEPIYELDITQCLKGEWEEGVELRGVRTHFYQDNTFLKDQLQPRIIPQLLLAGIIEPIKQRIIEGSTILERAQHALDLLRLRSPSGEKLVWRVSDE